MSLSFGTKLKKAREDADVSQLDLAKAIGVHDRTVSYWERGLAYPKIDAAIKICKFLNTPLSSLIDDEDQFFLEVNEKYGEGSITEAQKVIEQTRALFFGGKLDDNEKDKIFRVITEMYFDAKDKSRGLKS